MSDTDVDDLLLAVPVLTKERHVKEIAVTVYRNGSEEAPRPVTSTQIASHSFNSLTTKHGTEATLSISFIRAN